MTSRTPAMLEQIRETEQKAHDLWDQAYTTMAYSNPPEERQEVMHKKTYEATRLHKQAKDMLDKLIEAEGDDEA